MCNAVCVGIGQFFGPMAIAVALVAIVGAFLSANRERDRRRYARVAC
jgi:hypothetical protein